MWASPGRQVGQALKYLPEPRDADGNENVFNHGNVPWQRVIASTGVVPQRYVSAVSFNIYTHMHTHIGIYTLYMYVCMYVCGEYTMFHGVCPSWLRLASGVVVLLMLVCCFRNFQGHAHACRYSSSTYLWRHRHCRQ